MKKIVLFFLILFCCGCGPTKREKAHFYGSINAPVEMLRTWAIENEYQMFTGRDPRE